jgi:YHS domain-containing protein
MFIRALIELIFAVVFLIAARAILTTVLKGLLTVGKNVERGNSNPTPPADPVPPGRELHKDPVCGTYVTDSTPYHRQACNNTFYYCSEYCMNRHMVAAR